MFADSRLASLLGRCTQHENPVLRAFWPYFIQRLSQSCYSRQVRLSQLDVCLKMAFSNWVFWCIWCWNPNLELWCRHLNRWRFHGRKPSSLKTYYEKILWNPMKSFESWATAQNMKMCRFYHEIHIFQQFFAFSFYCIPTSIYHSWHQRSYFLKRAEQKW